MLCTTARRRWLPAALAPVTVGIALAGVAGCASELSSGASPSVAPVSPADARPNTAILTWNTAARDALVAHDKYANPLAAARVYALVHLAQHDAVNATAPAFDSYAFDGRDMGADPEAAGAAAAHAVLTTTFPAQQPALDATLAAALAAVPDGDAETRGVALGRQAAAAILALRATDGSDTPIVGDYVPRADPGPTSSPHPSTSLSSPAGVRCGRSRLPAPTSSGPSLHRRSTARRTRTATPR